MWKTPDKPQITISETLRSCLDKTLLSGLNKTLLSGLDKTLFSCLDKTIFNEEARNLHVQSSVRSGILMNLMDYVTVGPEGGPDIGRWKIGMGSRAEGSSLQLTGSDLDILVCRAFIEAKPKNATDLINQNDLYLCMSEDSTTTTGYTKIQIYQGERPALDDIRLEMFCLLNRYWLAVDENEHCFIKNTLKSIPQDLYRLETHGPAVTQLVEASNPTDYVQAIPCKDLPQVIAPWFERERKHGWPSSETCRLFKKMGCFVVAVGNVNSPEKDLEWRVSFSYQEQHLMLNLNPTQYRCYIVLKLIKKLIFQTACKEVISSYHCKTALFYTIENNSETIWRPDKLEHCVYICIQQLYTWVSQRNCPNYFIPDENMFETKLINAQHANLVKRELKHILINYHDLLNRLKMFFSSISNSYTKPAVLVANAIDMRRCLTHLTTFVSVSVPRSAYDIDKVIEYLEDFTNRMQIIKDLLSRKEQVNDFCPFTENNLILLLNKEHLMQADDGIIDKLSSKKYVILEMFEYAQQYVKSKLACLYLTKEHQSDPMLMHLYGTQDYEKYALKVDSSQYYMRIASNDFQNGKHLSCRASLNKSMVTSYTIPNECKCPYGLQKRQLYQHIVSMKNKEDCCKKLNPAITLEELQFQIKMCLVFDTLEIKMVPIALLYEAHREFGIPRVVPKHKLYDSWFSWVVIDPKIYLYFLQYKNEETLGDMTAVSDALEQMEETVLKGLIDATIVHIETALNVLGHIYVTKGWYRLALQCFKRSWMVRPNLNAAKWHAMFVLSTEK